MRTAILIISVSAIVAAVTGWKDWASLKERQHSQNLVVRLAGQETERLKIVTDALRGERNNQDRGINGVKGSRGATQRQ